MTDVELIEKKLAFIETCVRQLRDLGQPERIPVDVREERFAAHTLQIAIQAAQDVASHIVSEGRLGEPETNRELFELLRRNGWLDPELSVVIQRMVEFRNLVVHGYQSLNPAIQDLVVHRLDDLLAFVGAIRSRLPDS
ncbi:MAG: DUF86 domain-containing protein [Candidatus Competibacteraceae bacterium]|nr:MAG: DUF86 domain-containing protein [Candidatus Competibacteraceae bacterium]